jgi:hypothetical protein
MSVMLAQDVVAAAKGALDDSPFIKWLKKLNSEACKQC